LAGTAHKVVVLESRNWRPAILPPISNIRRRLVAVAVVGRWLAVDVFARPAVLANALAEEVADFLAAIVDGGVRGRRERVLGQWVGGRSVLVGLLFARQRCGAKDVW
jgi:hypothetical protein